MYMYYKVFNLISVSRMLNERTFTLPKPFVFFVRNAPVSWNSDTTICHECSVHVVLKQYFGMLVKIDGLLSYFQRKFKNIFVDLLIFVIISSFGGDLLTLLHCKQPCFFSPKEIRNNLIY